MAFWDRTIRILFGIILIWLGIEKGDAWIIGEVFGYVLIFTGLTGFCPIYKIAGVSSGNKDIQTA
ncbi:YgaP family membrane protein [Persephonella sp.]